jgi:hypothetical protein
MKLTRRSSLSLMAGAALAMPYKPGHAQEEAVLNVFAGPVYRRDDH